MNDEKNKKKAEVILSALKGKNQLKEISEFCDLFEDRDTLHGIMIAKIIGSNYDKSRAIDYLLETNEQLISIIRGFIETYNYVIDFMSELSAEAIDNINDDQNDGGIKK
jgi:hypothetical protein